MAQTTVLSFPQNPPPPSATSGIKCAINVQPGTSIYTPGNPCENEDESLDARGLAIDAKHRGEFAPPSSGMDLLAIAVFLNELPSNGIPSNMIFTSYLAKRMSRPMTRVSKCAVAALGILTSATEILGYALGDAGASHARAILPHTSFSVIME
ncbi:hypothetical protein KIN20_019417 [Parelaphostrongylus tenuis]|uniref:Uncharacterized protein n=1 Tax=Parelaphostrongylus tenuis TaxID=148309 RepID=A0AAD5QQ80_PARTN|nr:hypothetical protein KIN20_019417 [Parelaphostrongylus tenuis]